MHQNELPAFDPPEVALGDICYIEEVGGADPIEDGVLGKYLAALLVVEPGLAHVVGGRQPQRREDA